MDISITNKESFTFIGLSTVCHLTELKVEGPKLWVELDRRKNEISNRQDMNYRVGLFLGRDGDMFSEAVGLVVEKDAPVPEGMIKVSVPAASSY